MKDSQASQFTSKIPIENSSITHCGSTVQTEMVEEHPVDIVKQLTMDTDVKCGEIFSSNDGTYILICAFCHGKFEDMRSFGEHIACQHVPLDASRQTFDRDMLTAQDASLVAKVEPSDAPDNVADTLNLCAEVKMNEANESKSSSTEDIEENNLSENVSYKKYKTHALKRHQMTTRRSVKSNRSARKIFNIIGEMSDDKDTRDVLPVELENKDSILPDSVNISNTPEQIHNGNHIENSCNSVIKSDREDEEASEDIKIEKIEDDEQSKSEDEQFSGKNFVCEVCNRTYKSKRSLARHKRRPHPIAQTPTNDLFCKFCNKLLGSKRSMWRHRQRHGCSATRTNMKSTQRKFQPDPVKDDTKGNSFHCDICDNYFRTKLNLQIHSDDHDTLPAVLEGCLDFLKCKFCNQEFSKYAERKEHESIHTGDRPYECPYCHKGFPTNYDRKIHIRWHTGEVSLTCPHCAKSFKNSTDLKRHVVRHLNIRDFGCDMCDKRFYRKFELVRHMRTHTKERPYVCEDCGVTYPCLAQLKDHQLRHTGVKNIKCEICGRLFYSKSVLKVHMPTHFDEKPFKCDVCGRAFSRAKAMQKHQKLHSGEKKYVCNICGKAYAQDSGLYAHKKTHGANIV